MVQELTKFEIDVNNVIINQVLYPDKGSNCALCAARSKMQTKYIDQICDLYEDFHIIKLPLQRNEIRGSKSLSEFSKLLLNPYDEYYIGLNNKTDEHSDKTKNIDGKLQ